jgi:polysaccharide biosynthesis protein PslH
MALPVVSTRVGAEGLDITDKVDIRLEDEPEAFAEAVIELLKSPAERTRLGGNARRLVCEKFSWGSVTDQFEAYLTETVERAQRR